MIIAALVLALAPATLDTPAYGACMQKAESTLAMHDCVGAEADRWDKRLNGAYQRLLATSSPARRAVLRQSERDWLGRRESGCAHAGDGEAGGSLQPLEIEQCQLRATQKRAAVLESRR